MPSPNALPDGIRNLVLVLGDQLNLDSAGFDDFAPEKDVVWMAEVRGESEIVPSHKARTALFLSAMRHFRDQLSQKSWPVYYVPLDDLENTQTLAGELSRAVHSLQPEAIVVVQPGEYRTTQELKKAAIELGYDLLILPDRHFLCSPEEFADHAQGRKELRMEYFYREMRKRYDILMDQGKPAGGSWNYDSDNRGSFSRKGPPDHSLPKSFPPDDITADVLELVQVQFANNPGSLDHFDWPVTPQQAVVALHDFIDSRLPFFGDYQDAMWEGKASDPFLFHSRISAALNLKLLHPLQVIQAAVDAYQADAAPLNAVEGFVRQILGWREYVRGIYWMSMPQYLERNALQAKQSLPDFFWTGKTEMNCLHQTIQQTLDYGYAHHIQRLMVTGLFNLLLGVDPVQVHQWYLSVYVDAVEWVELPNSLGMSQYADGGVMASKPYIASGSYIDRMSNYCKSCRFDPKKKTGEDACPFTVLYWDFLNRHQKSLSENHRMGFQLKNLKRLSDEEIGRVSQDAERIRSELQPETTWVDRWRKTSTERMDKP